jgi:hypothetical protein
VKEERANAEGLLGGRVSLLHHELALHELVLVEAEDSRGG